MGVVKLGFVVDDTFAEISILHNVGFKAPIICVLDHIKEDSVARGWPLKGFMEPMGYRLCRVSCVLGHCINFAGVGEVMRTVFLQITSHMAIVKLLDPFCWVGEPIAAGDGEVQKLPVFSIAIWGLGEGVNVPDETGLQELDTLFEVIHAFLVLFFLGGKLVFEVVGVCF